MWNITEELYSVALSILLLEVLIKAVMQVGGLIPTGTTLFLKNVFTDDAVMSTPTTWHVLRVTTTEQKLVNVVSHTHTHTYVHKIKVWNYRPLFVGNTCSLYRIYTDRLQLIWSQRRTKSTPVDFLHQTGFKHHCNNTFLGQQQQYQDISIYCNSLPFANTNCFTSTNPDISGKRAICGNGVEY